MFQISDCNRPPDSCVVTMILSPLFTEPTNNLDPR